MENKKTISHLNSKAWYRALKVVYIVFVIWCFGMAIMGSAMYGVDTFESQKSYEEKQADKEIRLARIQGFQDAGYTTKQITDALKARGQKNFYAEEFNKIYSNEKEFNPLPINKEPQSSSMLWLLIIVPGSLILAWLVSQIPKWIFYYIYLGQIKPEK